MLKRILALFLVCVLAIPIFAVPASAATTSGPMLTGAFDHEMAGYLYDLWKYFTVIDENHWLVKLRDMLEDAWKEFWGNTQLAINVLVADYMPIIEVSLDNIYAQIVATKDMLTGVFNYCGKMYKSLSSIDVNLEVISSNLETWFNNQTQAFMQGFSEVYDHFIDLKTRLGDWFTNVTSEIKTTRESILNYLSELFTGEDGPNPDGFNESMDGQETQFDEMVDIMETSPTIDLDQIEDVFQDDYTDQMDTNYLSLLGQMMQMELVLTPLLISILCAMLGYILYGKR